MARRALFSRLGRATATALVVSIVLTCRPTRLRAQQRGAPAANAEAIVDQLAQAIKGLHSLQLTGTTKLEQLLRGQGQTAEARFELKIGRPDRFYFESRQQQAGFVALWDGKLGWMYAIHEKQYQKLENLTGPEDLIAAAVQAADVVGLPLMYARHVLAADPKSSLTAGVTQMELSSDEASGDHVLTLHKQAGEMEKLTVAKSDFLLRRLVVDLAPRIRNYFTSQGRIPPADLSLTVTVEFTETVCDQPIDDAIFSFAPPEGVELVQQFGPQLLTGKPALDFTLTSLSGEQVTLSQLRGTVVLLVFWAPWCEPTVDAMPYLEKLHQEFGEKGMVLLGLTNEEEAPAQSFVKQHGVTFTILLDAQNAVGRTYRVTAIPRTLIIDTKGTVHADFHGLHLEEDVRAALAELGIK